MGKYGAWHAGDKNALTYRSAQAYDILKGPQSPSAGFIKALGLSSAPANPVVLSCLAGTEVIAKQGKPLKLKNALKLSAEIAQGVDQTTAGVLKTAATENIFFMEDVAKFIYEQMITNIGSNDATILRRANRAFYKIFVSLASSISFVQALTEIVMAKIDAYELWASKVAENNDWDHKGEIETIYKARWFYDPVTRVEYNYDIFSNIHYGYIGLSVGFTEIELLSGAGAAQIKTIYDQYNEGNHVPAEDALERIRNAPLTDIIKAIDDPVDQAAIKVGMSLWEKAGSGLDLDMLLREIRFNSSRLSTR